MEERQEKSTYELAHEPAHDVGRWLETPRGRYVMGWERPRVDAQVADVFGYNALQLGLPQVDFLAHNRIPVRQIIGESGAVDVRCTLCELPFASASIDLVVMPHVLEFHDDPHQILREVERILIPDGQIVITGFNPISLWGLRRIVRHRRRHFPDNGDFISVLRLRDWLRLLGFEVDRGNFGCYVPPFRHERWLRRFQFMEAAGDRWWSFAGGVYLLRAVKRVRGMRLILPDWKRQHGLRQALTPATRQALNEESQRHER